MSTNFGQRVAQLRRERGLTQQAVADHLGVNHTYLSKIEHGRLPHAPSAKLIHNLAALLGANEEELLGLAGQFEVRQLRRVVRDVPAMGVLLRRLQTGAVTAAQAQQILAFLDCQPGQAEAGCV